MGDIINMKREKKTKNKRKKKNYIKTTSNFHKNNNMQKNKVITTPTIVDKDIIINSGIENKKPIEVYDNYAENKIVNNKESEEKHSHKQYLLSGACGAIITIVLIIIVAISIPGFRYTTYYVNEDPSLLTQLLSCSISKNDSTNVTNAITKENTRRIEVIEDLLDKGVIVSSETFASNLSNYYNALIAVLAAMLVILNLLSIYAWHSNATESLEQEKRKLTYEIDNIDKRLELNIEDILRSNQPIREKLEASFQRLIDQDNHLEDEEWEKLRLLLKKYEYQRKDILLEINKEEDDDKNNDGSIEYI